MTKKSYNLTHNPYGKLKEGKSNNDPLKQVVYLRGENNKLRFDIQAVKTELVRKSAIAKEHKEENKALREFKKNWLELKTQIVFTILNYSEEHDTEVAAQILKEMNKLEAGE